MIRKNRVRNMNEFQKIEKEIEDDVEEVEKWVIERRKFFIKLSIVIIFVILLILFSKYFLK